MIHFTDNKHKHVWIRVLQQLKKKTNGGNLGGKLKTDFTP